MSAEPLASWSELDPDDARPISAQPAYVEIHATRCNEDDGVDGGLVFGDDEPLARLDDIEDFPGPGFSRVAHRSISRVRTSNLELIGHCLVTTAHPYASDWYEVATFKGKTPKNYTKKQLCQMRWKLLEGASGDPQALKDHPYDFAETNPAYLTARMYKPERLAEEFTSGRRSNASGKLGKPMWLWGLCRDYQEAHRRLELSTQLESLVRAAEQGTLYFQFIQGRRQVRKDGALAERPSPCVLFPELRNKAESVRQYAISKALAGPPDGSEWKGRPVVELAARIFRSQFNNMNRRAARCGGVASLTETVDPRPASEQLPPLDELVGLCDAQLDCDAAPDKLADFEERALELLASDERDDRLVGIAIALSLVRRGRAARPVTQLLQALAQDPGDSRQQHDAELVWQVASRLGGF